MGTNARFVWHDLMAADVEGAKSFYGELFGWKFKRGEGDSNYEHIYAGEQGIGGVMKNDPQTGAPPHWLGYVAVDDVDQTVATITTNGGKVYMPKMDIPTVGSFAVTADPDKASKFYSAVFGWDIETMEMPNFGTYTLLKRKGVKDETGADKNAGGIMKLPPSVPHPFWLAYVAVPDCDAVVAKATKLGGVVPMPPMDIPDVGRIATILDPQQVPIAVLAPKR